MNLPRRSVSRIIARTAALNDALEVGDSELALSISYDLEREMRAWLSQTDGSDER